MQFSQFIGLLVPEKSTITHKEILITSTSAFIGVAMLAYVSSLFVSGMSLPILVGSMGAASVLLFAAPSSPMSKPWAVFGGNVVSALVGVTCSRYIGDIHIESDSMYSRFIKDELDLKKGDIYSKEKVEHEIYQIECFISCSKYIHFI